MTTPIYPFSTLRYSLNPSIWQPGQTVTITPYPGSTEISYAITGGSLPSGLTLNPTTGVISGTAGSPIPETTFIVTGTLPNSTMLSCSIAVTIETLPIIAPATNFNASTDLTGLQATAAQNFINGANQVIANNAQLGMFHAWFDVLPHLPLCSLRSYFQSLGYTFWVTEPSYNGYAVSLEPYSTAVWSDFSSAGYPYNLLNYNTPEAYWYGAPQSFAPPPRILIKWNSTPVYPTYPYFPF